VFVLRPRLSSCIPKTESAPQPRTGRWRWRWRFVPLYSMPTARRMACKQCRTFLPRFASPKAMLATTRWRQKQLEYTWLRSVSVEPTDSSCREPMEKYLAFDPYPEVLDAIKAPSGFRLAILSNGSPAILDALVKASAAAAAVGQRDHRRSCEDLQAQSEILRAGRADTVPRTARGAFQFVQRLRHRRSQAVWLHHGLGRARGARAAEGFERRAEVSPELSAAARRNWCRRRTPAFRRLPDLPKLVATLDR
jgi:hypothetical protein